MLRKSLKLLLSALVAVLALLAGGCLSAPKAECTQEGQIVWNRGADPGRDAPRWTRSQAASLRAARVTRWEVPERYVVYVGVSEDKATERSALFSGIDDMLKRYAVWLQGELDRILPEAAQRAKVPLPQVNTALGAYQAVGYLSKEDLLRDVVRATWQAEGRRCPVESGEPAYRVYVLGRFDDKAREAHLLEAAIETFKYTIIRAEDREAILGEAQRLIRRI
jgi:hypothetical protein